MLTVGWGNKINSITNDNGQFWQTPSNQDTGADTQVRSFSCNPITLHI